MAKNALQAQLLKAGLVDQKKIKKANAQHDHARRTGEVTLKDELAADVAARQAAERDKALRIEAEKKQQREQHEHHQRLGQILSRHAVKKQNGEQAFQFIDQGKIKKLYLSQTQYNQVVNGQLVIASYGGQHFLLPYPLYDRIQPLWPDAIIVNHRQPALQTDQDNAPATAVEDDPYAAYAIPDDLIW